MGSCKLVPAFRGGQKVRALGSNLGGDQKKFVVNSNRILGLSVLNCVRNEYISSVHKSSSQEGREGVQLPLTDCIL